MRKHASLLIGLCLVAAIAFTGCRRIASKTRKLGNNAHISECGWVDTAQRKELNSQPAEDHYCSDERLIWQYNPES